MTVRDGQPSPAQARMMAKVFIIATLLGGALVFLNVTMRSYNIRQQQQAEKLKLIEPVPVPASPIPVPAPAAQP